MWLVVDTHMNITITFLILYFFFPGTSTLCYAFVWLCFLSVAIWAGQVSMAHRLTLQRDIVRTDEPSGLRVSLLCTFYAQLTNGCHMFYTQGRYMGKWQRKQAELRSIYGPGGREANVSLDVISISCGDYYMYFDRRIRHDGPVYLSCIQVLHAVLLW